MDKYVDVWFDLFGCLIFGGIQSVLSVNFDSIYFCSYIWGFELSSVRSQTLLKDLIGLESLNSIYLLLSSPAP